MINLKKVIKEATKDGVVPASSKVDSEKNRFLSPASYDEKLVKATFGPGDPDFHDKEDATDQSFKDANLVKKHKGLPLREDGETSQGGLSGYAVNKAYMDEAYELLEEITDLIEDLDIQDGESYSYSWRELAKHLREGRDCLLNAVIKEDVDFLEEAAATTSYKLEDGTSYKVSAHEAKLIKFALKNTKDQDKFLKDVTKNKHEFKEFLKFARSLYENYSNTLDNLIESFSDLEGLEDLSEAEMWKKIKQGARTGAYRGAMAGGVVGATTGGVVGGAAGAVKGGVEGSAYGKTGTIARGGKTAVKWGTAGTAIGAAGGASVGAAGGAVVGGAAGAVKHVASMIKRKKNKNVNEGEIWNATKAGARGGAAIGGFAGKLGGTVVGGVYGGAALGSVAAAKRALEILNASRKKNKPSDPYEEALLRRQEELLRRRAGIHEERDESVLGTAAPAMDTDPKKKKNLDEAHFENHQFKNSIGGDASNYRTPTKNIEFAKTEPGKKLDYYIITPHDVIGKAPKREGDVFRIKVDRNISTEMKLIKTVGNRFYAKPLKEDLDEGLNASIDDYINKFQKSKNPMFKGNSKKKRKERAIAAYMQATKGKKE